MAPLRSVNWGQRYSGLADSKRSGSIVVSQLQSCFGLIHVASRKRGYAICSYAQKEDCQMTAGSRFFSYLC
jgi:hypothetical protein